MKHPGLLERFSQLAKHGDQDEAFRLAQALGREHFPHLQEALDTVRREVMDLLTQPTAVIMGHVVAPHKRPRDHWSDHQITPEVSRDGRLTGLIVPRRLSQRLITLHKQQVSALTGLLRDARGKQ